MFLLQFLFAVYVLGMVLPSPSLPLLSSHVQTTQHAQAQSYGYVIPQDSDYNNFILPVLPRFNAQGELKQPHITSK